MIIDFHAHTFPDKIAERTINLLSKSGNIKPYASGTLDGLKSAISKANVDIAVNLPVLTNPLQFDSVFQYAKNINETFKTEKTVISFAGIHPNVEDIKGKMRKIKEAGFLGIKIHPDYQNTFFDDDAYVEILKSAKDNDLIVVTHAGVDGAYVGEPIKCTPNRVVNVLNKIGGYEKLVLAHCGGNELFEDVFNVLAGKNIYFDTAFILDYINKETFINILEKHGEDKILFATDSPWRDIKKDVEIVKSLDLKKEVEDKIFYKNALRLLKGIELWLTKRCKVWEQSAQ